MVMKPTTRNDFGSLFERYKLKGEGVEIGVQNGFNALQISKQWSGCIYLVDKWTDEECFTNAHNNLSGANVVFMKGASVEVAKFFEHESLDWIYIDADHAYEAVKADYEAWYPKVRKGGIISGHDYSPITNKNDCDGVRQFVEELGIPFNLTTDDFFEGMEYQSWWFVKGEETKLMDVI